MTRRYRAPDPAPATPQPLRSWCPVPATTTTTASPGNAANNTTAQQHTTTPQSTWLSSAPLFTEGPSTHPLARMRNAAPRQAGMQESQLNGVRLTGSDVSPDAMLAAERIVVALTGHREDIRERLDEANTRVMVLSSEQALTDLPELQHLHNTLTADGCRHWQDVRGSGGTPIGDEWIMSMPEENLVRTTTGRPDEYPQEHSVGLHELAHTILLQGVTDDERKRVAELYGLQRSDTNGFTDSYGGSNVDEYFAQSTGAFFGLINDEGPEWLQLHDPDMYAMLESIYGTPQAALARAAAHGAPQQGAPVAPAAPDQAAPPVA
ncbi:MAG: hypothetical protein H6737_18825 [Alphaproteobacteria bacterium]|nr:hypothetical protein [Alphaproteobacteria bacterium]